MIYLFAKPHCPNCAKLKKEYRRQLKKAKICDIETVDGLTELSYYELFDTAQRMLPLLIVVEQGKVTHRAGGYEQCTRLLQKLT
jgi:glutaredoxin